MSEMPDGFCPLLLVGGKGGHGEQLKRLRAQLGDVRVVVILERGMKWHYLDRVYQTDQVVDNLRRDRLKSVRAFISGMKVSLNVIRECRPTVIVSTGPSLSVPVCLVARLLGRVQVIHIESWSRIRSVSRTTRLLRMLRLVDVVAYQYPDSVLSGQKRCEYWGHL